MVSNAKVARHTVWAVLGQGAGQILSLISFLFIARFVSQASFGLVAVSLAAIEIVRRIVIDPITYGLTAKTDVTDRDYNVSLTLLVLIGALTSAVMFALAGPLAALIGTPSAAQPLRILSLLLFTYGLAGTHGAWLVRNMRFRALALRSTISVVIGGGIGIAMALNGFEMWSLVGQQLAINVISLVTLWSSTDWRPRPVLRRADIKDTYHSIRHISLSAVWTSIGNDVDLFFASAWFGPAIAGIYNAAKRILLSATLMLVHAISAVSLSAFASIEDDEHRCRELCGGLRFTSAITAPAFAGLAATAPEVVHVILGDRWASVAPILSALALSGYLLSLGIIASSALLVAQRSHLDSLSSAITAAANVIAFLAMVHFGPVALAVTVSIMALLLVPMRLGFALRAFGGKWRDAWRAVLPSLSATGVMLGGLLIVRYFLPAGLPAIELLPALTVTGALLYLIALRLFSRTLFELVLGAVGVARFHRPAVAPAE